MSTSATVQLASRVAVIGIGYLRDRIRGTGRPPKAGEVPASVEALTPDWLTNALCRDVPEARVLNIDIGSGSDGTSCRRPLTIEYNDAGRTAGLPTELFTKTSASFTSRLTLGASGVVEGEILFYNEVRPNVELNTPHGYHCVCDTRWWQSMIIVEDVARTRGCTFGAPTQALTRHEAESMVEQMAAYHGAYWNSPAFANELRRLKDAKQFQTDLNVIGFPKRTPIGIDRSAHVIPSAILARKNDVFAAYMKSLDLHAGHPRTLLHQDTHPGNWLRTPDGQMGLYDWAGLAHGHWALDYAYAITTNLETDDRRAWEQDLLRLYLHHLAEAGAGTETPSYDDAWLAYRQHPLHGLVWWLFTIGSGKLQPDMQPAEHSLINIRRCTQAVTDLDTLRAISTP